MFFLQRGRYLSSLSNRIRYLPRRLENYRFCSSLQAQRTTASGNQNEGEDVRDDWKYAFMYPGVIGLLGYWWNKEDDVQQWPYVVVGGGTTGLMAAQGIRLQDPKAKVLIINGSDTPPFKRRDLTRSLWYAPDELATQLLWSSQSEKDKEYVESIFYGEDVFYGSSGELIRDMPAEDSYSSVDETLEGEFGGICLDKVMRVKGLKPSKKLIETKEHGLIKYDKCLIVSDAVPKREAILDEKCPKFTTYQRTPEDFLKLRALSKKGSKIAIVGGGQEACQLAMAMSFQNEKTEIVMIYPEKYLMSEILPEELAEFVTDDLILVDGVKYQAETRIEDANVHGRKVNLTLSSGEEITVDHIVVAKGDIPDCSMCEQFNLSVHERLHGCTTNEYYRSMDGLYAAGDGVVFKDPLRGARCVLGENQRELSGRLAGFNMAGANMKIHREAHEAGIIGPRSTYMCLGDCKARYETMTFFPEKSDKKTEGKQCAVVFYLKNAEVCGIALWNIAGYRHLRYSVDLARMILKSTVWREDVRELAKKFRLNTYEDLVKELQAELDTEEEMKDMKLK